MTAITEETGTETFDVSGFTQTLTIIKTPISNTNDKTLNINENNSKFRIYLYSSDFIPTLYSSETDLKQTISCEQPNAYLECTPNEYMERNDYYPIYYKDQCNGIQPTGITFKVFLKREVSPIALSFESGSRCLMDPTSTVTVIISFANEMYGNINEAFLKNSNGNSFSLKECSPDGQTVICKTDMQLTSNSYRFGSMEATDFTISKNDTIEPLITFANPIGTNMATQTVIDGASDFIIKIMTTSPPNFYVGKDKTKILDCTLGIAEVSCHTDDTLMPDAQSYEIYWESPCGEMNKINNFEVVKKFKTPMQIVSISLSSEEAQTCSTSPFTSLYVTTATKVTGTVSKVVLTDGTNDLTFSSCNIADTVITCDANAESAPGTYTFKSMSASDFSFTYTGEEFIHEVLVNPLAKQEGTKNTDFGINSSQLSFVITLETGVAKPSLYLGNDEDKEISCELENNQLTCTLESEKILIEDSYSIYYKAACGKLYESKLTVSKIKEVIKVTSIAIVGESAEGTCLKNPFNTVKVGVEKDPKDVTAIVLTANSVEYTFSTCSSNESYILCSDPDKEIIAETYEIKAIKSVTYNFNFDEVDNSLKYTEDFLDEATEKNQEINNDVSEITVILNAKTDIYIGRTEGQIKVECTKNKDNNVYSCPIYLMDFGTDTTLQVYYIDSCGKLTDSAITLKIVHPTQIQITNVSLVEESKCVVNSLQSVTLTSDKPPKSKIYFATLVSSAEPNQEFDLESCTFEGTAITCSFADNATPITIAGSYKLKEVKGVDTVTVSDEAKEIALELKEQESVLGEQSNAAPTVNNDTTTFTIVLASEETEAPKVYCEKDKEQEITCEKTGKDLVCTPTETNMPSAGEYEIYYADLCGNLQTTGITVTYEQKAEIVIETKGGFIMYKFILGIMLMLMF